MAPACATAGFRSAPRMSFGDAGAEQARVLHGWIGHPFSWPANLWFAFRHRVSPANYDLPLTSFMGDAIRPFGRIDIGGDESLPARRLVHARARGRL